MESYQNSDHQWYQSTSLQSSLQSFFLSSLWHYYIAIKYHYMYYWDWHLYFKYILLYFKYLFLYFLHRIRFFEIVFIQHYHYKISLDHSRLYLIRSGLSFWKRILSVNHLDLGDPKVVRSNWGADNSKFLRIIFNIKSGKLLRRN